MKMTRPAVTTPNLDSTAVQAYLEGAAPSSIQMPTQAPEKILVQKPERISVSRNTQKAEPKTKLRQTPAQKSSVKALTKRKELVMPETVVIDEKAIGKFLVDMPMVLRQKIKQKSLDTGRSMNELIITVLTQAFG